MQCNRRLSKDIALRKRIPRTLKTNFTPYSWQQFVSSLYYVFTCHQKRRCPAKYIRARTRVSTFIYVHVFLHEWISFSHASFNFYMLHSRNKTEENLRLPSRSSIINCLMKDSFTCSPGTSLNVISVRKMNYTGNTGSVWTGCQGTGRI